MKLLRPTIVIGLSVVLLASIVFWWNSPEQTDMAAYAPADSLVYLEINNVTDVVKAIQQNEFLKDIAPVLGLNSRPTPNWLLRAARVGLGSTDSVLLSRAQLALIVGGVDTSGNDDLVRVKPEVALIVETHTSKWRMKANAFNHIRQLANFAYGNSVCTERNSGSAYIECAESGGPRKLVGAVEGTVVILGNSTAVVENCIEVRRGQRPALQTDAEFNKSRKELGSDSNLAFGYVSHANSAKLISWLAPLMVGKAPGDRKFEDMLAKSATKVLRGVAWTSRLVNGGIEDRYQISLEPEVINRLAPAFQTGTDAENFWELVPDSFRTITVYRCKNPEAAWFSLESALATKLDAVSSVIVGVLLKAGLSNYGIDDPRPVLANLSAPLITIRPSLSEGSLLLARVKNEELLRQAIAKEFLQENRGQVLVGLQNEPSRDKEFTAILVDGYLVLGKTENMLVYLDQLRSGEAVSTVRINELKLSNRDNSSATVTYTNERASILSVLQALSRLGGHSLSARELSALEQRLNGIKVASTESSLNSSGIDRRTISSFGQFGTLLSFAEADSANRETH